MVFDPTGDRYDLIRFDDNPTLTAIHIPAEQNPVPPPGPPRHLWIAAVALDPANVDRFTAPPPSTPQTPTPTNRLGE